MNATTVDQGEITQFASAVRAALADLPPEEVDDLTDGLEADLTEAAAEGAAGLDDPARYAEELRQAAGYPAQEDRPAAVGLGERLRAAPREIRAEMDAVVERLKLRPVVEFLAALRPVWWVFRGWALYMIVAGVLGIGQAVPLTIAGLFLLIGSVIASVQLGRGAWRARGTRTIAITANVLVVIASPFILSSVISLVSTPVYAMEETPSEPWYGGLTVDGQQIGNIFAYDEQGNLLEYVQLFDERGEPLNLVSDPTATTHTLDGSEYVVPSDDVPGRPGWNVYPLSGVSPSDLTDDGRPSVDATPVTPKAPFESVRPLAGTEHIDEATLPDE